MSLEFTVAVLRAIWGICCFVVMLPVILFWFAVVWCCWTLLIIWCDRGQKYHYDIDSTAD